MSVADDINFNDIEIVSVVGRLYSELHSAQIDSEKHSSKLVRITLSVKKNVHHQKVKYSFLIHLNVLFAISMFV